MTDRIEKSIELAAPVAQVWRALTDAAQFGEWFRVKIDKSFAPGEVAHGHITHPGWEHVAWQVRIVEMRPQSLFSFAWHPYAVDPNVDYSGEPETLVEFRVMPTSDGTRLTVIESGFDALPEHRRAEALRMNDGGWAQQLVNIQGHVER